jgi:hypothetical protein
MQTQREREREREREEVSESLALPCFFCSVCTEGDEKKGVALSCLKFCYFI